MGATGYGGCGCRIAAQARKRPGAVRLALLLPLMCHTSSARRYPAIYIHVHEALFAVCFR